LRKFQVVLLTSELDHRINNSFLLISIHSDLHYIGLY